MVERLEVRGRCSGSARVGWKMCSVWFITVPWLTEQAQGCRRLNLGIFLDALLFIGPSYVANAAPLLLGGGSPLDRGKDFFDGRVVFGADETVPGLFAGIIA